MKTFKEYIIEKTEKKVVHFSHQPNLTVLSGSMYGSGIKGAEKQRLDQSKDDRIKKRVYFYNQTDSGIPRPEAGLGSHLYETTLNNIHDATKQSPEANRIALKAREYEEQGEHPHNAYERAVLDSGHHGYSAMGVTVVLNKDVPVVYKGRVVPEHIFVDHKKDDSSKSFISSLPNKEGYHTSEIMKPEQSQFYYSNRDKMKAIPANMEYGRLKIHQNDMGKFQNFLQEHPDHPFS